MIIILAGGRSTRMGKEKPVLKIAGREMLLWVYNAASRVDEVFVALSRNTPKTKELCLSEGIHFVETPGKGYVKDIQWLLNELGPFISSSADIPFVKPGDFYALEKAFDGKTSLTGVLSLEKVPKGFNPLVYRSYAIVGLNAVGFEGERFFELENPLLALNVNTPEELRLAERIARLVGRRDKGAESQ